MKIQMPSTAKKLSLLDLKPDTLARVVNNGGEYNGSVISKVKSTNFVVGISQKYDRYLIWENSNHIKDFEIEILSPEEQIVLSN